MHSWFSSLYSYWVEYTDNLFCTPQIKQNENSPKGSPLIVQISDIFRRAAPPSFPSFPHIWLIGLCPLFSPQLLDLTTVMWHFCSLRLTPCLVNDCLALNNPHPAEFLDFQSFVITVPCPPWISINNIHKQRHSTSHLCHAAFNWQGKNTVASLLASVTDQSWSRLWGEKVRGRQEEGVVTRQGKRNNNCWQCHICIPLQVYSYFLRNNSKCAHIKFLF